MNVKKSVLLISIFAILLDCFFIFKFYFRQEFLKSNFKKKRLNTISLKSNEKYILYKCDGQKLCGGLGDRFKAVINAYVWSLFTNRTLILNISEPCYFIKLMSPNEVKWNLSIDELIDHGKLERNFSKIELHNIDNLTFKNELEKIDILNYKKEISIISLFTNLEWISAYAKNIYLNSSIMKIGFTRDTFHFSTVFNKLFNKIFKLSAKVQEKFDNYLKKAKPNISTSKLICAQVRIGGTRPNVEYNQDITPRNFSTYYWIHIKEKFLKQMENDNYKIFVTADMESVEVEAVEVFGKDRVMKIEGASVHSIF